MNSGASRPPAVTGSITSRQQRDADDGEAAAERAFHEADQEDAGEGDEDGGNGQFHVTASASGVRRRAPAHAFPGSRRPSSFSRLVGTGEAADRPLDLASREADVPQLGVVELAKSRDGGAAGEIARDPVAAVAEQPRSGAGCLLTTGRAIIERSAVMSDLLLLAPGKAAP